MCWGFLKCPGDQLKLHHRFSTLNSCSKKKKKKDLENSPIQLYPKVKKKKRKKLASTQRTSHSETEQRTIGLTA